MHEASLMKDLLSKILQIASEQNAGRITKVKVRLGALSHMSPEHFREHFEQVAPGTLAEGAELEAELLTDIHDPQAQEILLESIEVTD